MSDKLNLRKVKKLVFPLIDDLENSKRTFHDVFSLLFREKRKTYLQYRYKGKKRSLTYGAVYNLILSKAHEIESILPKEEKGRFVFLKLDNCPQWVISFWAILMAGYKPFLVNNRLADNYNLKIAKEINPIAVISDKPFGDLLFIDALKEPTLDIAPLDESIFENEMALATSGTSGNPKICYYKGENIAAQLLQSRIIIKKDKDLQSLYHGYHRELAFLPFYHIFGFNAVLMWFSFFHQIIVFPSSMDAGGISNTIKTFEVTSFFSIPMVFNLVYRRIMENVEKRAEKDKLLKAIKLSTKLQNAFPRFGKSFVRKHIFKKVRENIFGPSLTFMISGGGYISKEAQYLFNGLGYTLINGYGMSEVGVTSFEMSQKVKDINKGSIGKPLPGIIYKIDEDNRLLIKGPSLAYKVTLNGEIVSRDEEGYFPTNDIVEKDKKGSYYIKGRSDEIIVLDNGELISPDQIEDELNADSVDAISVFYLDNLIHCIIKLSPDLKDINRYQIIQKIMQNNYKLPQFMRFSRIFMVNKELPVAMKGRVSRPLIVKDFSEHPEDYIELNPSDYEKSVEVVKEEINKEALTVIKEAFASSLGMDVSLINDNSHFIYDLKGDSIVYFDLLAILKDKLNLLVTPGEGSLPATPLEFLALYEKEMNK